MDVMSQLFNITGDMVSIGEFPKGDYTFGVFSNGIFEHEKIPYIGSFKTLKSSIELPLSGKTCVNSFDIGEDFTKIPISILFATIDFYRKIKEKISSEVMTMIVFDTLKRQYEIIVPIQKVSGATVKYDAPELLPHQKYIVGAHSHVDMQAFFSSVDDIDEKRAMFYMVIGQISSAKPAVKIRAKKGVVSFNLGIEDIFDVSSKYSYAIDESRMENVTQSVYTYPTTTHYNPNYYRQNVSRPNWQERAYDYLPRRTNYDYAGGVTNMIYGLDDDDFSFYDSLDPAKIKANNRFNRVKTDLSFIDPDFTAAITGLMETYAEYCQRNYNNDLSTEELEVDYLSICNSFKVVFDNLDVEEEFYEMLMAEMFGEDIIIEDEEDDNEENAPFNLQDNLDSTETHPLGT